MEAEERLDFGRCWRYLNVMGYGEIARKDWYYPKPYSLSHLFEDVHRSPAGRIFLTDCRIRGYRRRNVPQ